MPIIDQGYQHWSGQLSGHAWRWLAITRRGLKTALESRYVRLAALVCWLPALVLAFVLCMWGLIERQSDLVATFRPAIESLLGRPVLSGPRDYRVVIWTLSFHYFLMCELGLSMVFVLLVGPNLISQDLRYNAMPLYLSRPLRRIDYFAGKLGVIIAVLGVTMIWPAILSYIFGILFSLDITIVRDTWPILVGSVVYGLVIAVCSGLIMLALSSISRNSRYVAMLWLGFWIISGVASAVLVKVDQQQRMHAVGPRFRIWSNEQFLNDEFEAAKTNWRPLISYTANLSRIEEKLMSTNAAWKQLGDLSPSGNHGPMMQRTLYTLYPWYWSAGVLAALAAISVCTLTLTVRSLDRLK